MKCLCFRPLSLQGKQVPWVWHYTNLTATEYIPANLTSTCTFYLYYAFEINFLEHVRCTGKNIENETNAKQNYYL